MEYWYNITYSEISRVSKNIPYCLFPTTHLNGIILELNPACRREDLVPKNLTYGTE